MGVGCGFCQDIFNDSFSQPAGSLILFEGDENPQTSLDIASIYAIHKSHSLL